jgi:hypothetical protein
MEERSREKEIYGSGDGCIAKPHDDTFQAFVPFVTIQTAGGYQGWVVVEDRI